MVGRGWCSQLRASSELQFGVLREVWRHARCKEHCRGEPDSALSGRYAPDLAKAECISIVDEPGKYCTPVREIQRRNREVSEGKADIRPRSFVFLRGPREAANG